MEEARGTLEAPASLDLLRRCVKVRAVALAVGPWKRTFRSEAWSQQHLPACRVRMRVRPMSCACCQPKLVCRPRLRLVALETGSANEATDEGAAIL